MDLEQMKSGWNKLSVQLEKNNTINTRIVHEMIAARNRTNYEKIARDHKFTLSVLVLLTAAALPFLARTEIIQMSSAIIIEIALFASIAVTCYMLKLLSDFERSYRTVEQMAQNVISYKRVYSLNQRFGGAVAVVVIGAVYAIEQAFTTNAIIALVAALAAAVAFGVHQTKRHNHLLQDIESGLNELKEFGKQ